jgi:RNA polymerase sigma factor (sigma-70 family)
LNDTHTTAVLLNRVRGGDQSARQQLIERVQPLLMRFARGRLPQLLRGAQDTSDLIQLTWVKVIDKLEKLDCPEPGDFFSYLRTVLLNALRESIRTHNRRPQFAHEPDADIPAEGTSLEDWLAYEQNLRRLEPHHFSLVVMRFEFGMSFQEIGDEIAESADGVRMKLNRAIKRMAEVAA